MINMELETSCFIYALVGDIGTKFTGLLIVTVTEKGLRFKLHSAPSFAVRVLSQICFTTKLHSASLNWPRSFPTLNNIHPVPRRNLRRVCLDLGIKYALHTGAGASDSVKLVSLSFINSATFRLIWAGVPLNALTLDYLHRSR